MSVKNKEAGYLAGWIAAYVLLAGFFIFAVWNGQLDNFCTASEPAWLPWAQPEEHCFREWLSATAGWAGFVAAAIGAYFVLGQLDAQRRQTAFILGDGEPSIEILRNKRTNRSGSFARSGVIRIINWNRRSMSIRRVWIDCPHQTVPLNRVYFPRVDNSGFNPEDLVSIHHDHNIKRRAVVKGWLDRQSAPFYRDMYFIFQGEKNKSILTKAKEWDATLNVEYSYADDRAKFRILSVTGPFLELLPSNCIPKNDISDE